MSLNAQEVRERMPLAEAVLLVWRHVTDEAFLEQVFEANRGRGYTRILSCRIACRIPAPNRAIHSNGVQ